MSAAGAGEIAGRGRAVSAAGGSALRIWIDGTPPPEVEIPDGVVLVDGPEQADGVVVGSILPWGAEACDRYPDLKVVARSGVGYDNVDPAACAARGVAACNTPDAPTVSTAEHALALMLAVAKRLKPSAARLAEGRGGYLAAHRGLELDGRTLGLLGAGRIGARLAGYARALGMRVVACDPHLDAFEHGELVDLETLWAAGDVISLHAPATAETLRIVDAAALARMRPGVVIVNCARGSLVDHAALLAGLDSGRVAGAGLDVTDPEPLPPGHPLLDRDDVIVTPHVASATVAGRARLVSQALDQALCWLRGGTPEHLLDPAALDPAADRRTTGAGL